LHFLNGILVFLIARHIFSRSTASETETRTCALLAAAFLVVHRVQTEAVTYVSSRSELLLTAFYGFAVLSFIKRDPRKIGFLWSLMIAALFLLGLFSKETVISLPVILVAYDSLFFFRYACPGNSEQVAVCRPAISRTELQHYTHNEPFDGRFDADDRAWGWRCWGYSASTVRGWRWLGKLAS